jgi:hypothetical protein
MWIESHQSLRNHPKVKKAARLAGINEFEMIGRLHCLWWWALDYAPDGDLTNYSAADIESAVDWSGTEGAFYAALIGCGFNGHCGLIERDGNQTSIHDWHEYGGRLLERREVNKDRMRQRRAVHVQNTTATRIPATEQTEQTEQHRTEQTEQHDAARAAVPRAIQAYVDAGGKFQSGTLADGTTKKANACRVITETVTDDDESIAFWKRVVEAYCAQWSSKSYSVMLNEYYSQGRVPGQRKNGQSGNGSAPSNALSALERMKERTNGNE